MPVSQLVLRNYRSYPSLIMDIAFCVVVPAACSPHVPSPGLPPIVAEPRPSGIRGIARAAQRGRGTYSHRDSKRIRHRAHVVGGGWGREARWLGAACGRNIWERLVVCPGGVSRVSNCTTHARLFADGARALSSQNSLARPYADVTARMTADTPARSFEPSPPLDGRRGGCRHGRRREHS